MSMFVINIIIIDINIIIIELTQGVATSISPRKHMPERLQRLLDG
jgi:hypothetical protein